MFSGILHLIAIMQLFYALHFDYNLNIPNTKSVPKMLQNGYAGKMGFLTYWNLVSLTLFILKLGGENKIR
jgi:hypothetical protein